MNLESIVNPENKEISPTYMRIVGLMTLFLAAVGFVIVSSASMDVAQRTYDNEFYFIIRHFSYLVMAAGLGYLVFQVPLSTWQKSGGLLLMVSYILLVLVLIPGVGRTVNGSTRWIPMGLFSMQVSEVAKICVMCYVSGYLVRRHDEVRSSFWGFIKPVLVLSIMVMLLLLQSLVAQIHRIPMCLLRLDC